MKKITLLITVLIIFNFIYSSFFTMAFANPDPSDPADPGSSTTEAERINFFK